MYNRNRGRGFRILAGFGKKYADEKQFFRTLPLHGHVGLPTDKMAMSLVPEDLHVPIEGVGTCLVFPAMITSTLCSPV